MNYLINTPLRRKLIKYIITGGMTAVLFLLLSWIISGWIENAFYASSIAYFLIVFFHFTMSNYYTFEYRDIKSHRVIYYLTTTTFFMIVNYASYVFLFNSRNDSIYYFLLTVLVMPFISALAMFLIVFKR